MRGFAPAPHKKLFRKSFLTSKIFTKFGFILFSASHEEIFEKGKLVIGRVFVYLFAAADSGKALHHNVIAVMDLALCLLAASVPIKYGIVDLLGELICFFLDKPLKGA